MQGRYAHALIRQAEIVHVGPPTRTPARYASDSRSALTSLAAGERYLR
jgi:hypothetical protein